MNDEKARPAPFRTRAPIAVTGIGAVTPYGVGVETLWQALLHGDSAISDLDLFDLGGIACTRAGVIRGYTPPAGYEHAPRASGFAAGACLEALRQAGLFEDPASLANTALITASNFGDLDAGEAALIPADLAGHTPAASPDCAHARPAERLAEAFGLGGPRIPVSLSCASGASALATAATLIAAGHLHRVLVVGYDALSRFAWSGLCSLRTMTKDAVRPFDAQRNGTIFSEGAAALLLERADLCAARGAQPLAYLSGWATGNNGHHLTAPAPRGAGSADVMRRALARAGLAPEAVGHINAHGTGTQPNDLTETQAIEDVFGTYATRIPVTSVKGALGHLLGAAGAVEAAVTVLSLQHGLIPPTANLQTQDPACPLDIVTAPRPVPLDCALSNSAGFGGCNAAVVLTRAPVARPIPEPKTTPIGITGLGIVSALGADAIETAASLTECEPALAPPTRLAAPPDTAAFLVGEAPDPDMAACGVAPKAYLDRASLLFLAACGQAIKHAGLDAETLAACSTGVLAGTAWGCLETAERFFDDYRRKGARLVKPFLFPHTYANAAVSLAAMEWALKGAHENIAASQTASGIAFLEAVELLRAGEADLLLAGGTDALSATALHARRTAGETAPPGEAAAVAVLTTRPAASAPLGRILGCGLATTAREAARAALTQAGIPMEKVKTVSANATVRAEAGTLDSDPHIEDTARLTGDVQGATTAVQLALALLTPGAGPTLILTAETSLCIALLVDRG